MPTFLTDPRHPIPPSLAEKLIALGADAETIKRLTHEIEQHHASIRPPQPNPDVNADDDMEML